jgi:hypothetical protein
MSQKYKLFQYCPVKDKVVPVEEVQRRAQSNARDLFIQDEMEPTRNPLNPKEVYTSNQSYELRIALLELLRLVMLTTKGTSQIENLAHPNVG